MGLFRERKKEKEKREKEQREQQAVQNVVFGDALTFGQILNNYTAMNVSAFFAATSLISNTIAMLPVKVLVSGVDGKNENEQHPIIKALNSMPNISKFSLLKLIVQSVILRGNAFVYIERKGNTVTGLRYLESGDVTINYQKEQNKLYYQSSIISSKYIQPKDMLHFVLNSYDGVNGISLLSYAKRTLAITNSSENSAKNFFDNGMNVNGILKVLTPISQKQKEEIRQSWQQAYSGNGGLAVINANMEYQQLTLSPEDAQLLSSRQFNIADIARFFNLNPLLLGGESGATYSSLEMLQNAFLIHTLQPYISMIEAEMNRKLLGQDEQNLEVILETNDLLRIDKQSQANYYKIMIDSGVLSRNEVRKEIGYGPFDGGEIHTIAYSDTTQNTLGNNDQNNSDSEGITNEED